MPQETSEFSLSPAMQHTVNEWVHGAVKEAYTRFGDGVDKNSAGDEYRSPAVKALDFLQIVPYAAYYGSYQAARGINWVGEHLGEPGSWASHIIAAPLAPMEAAGLLANEAITAGILALNHGKANMYEDIYGTVVPHFAWNNAPTVYLPGVHTDGSVDFEW